MVPLQPLLLAALLSIMLEPERRSILPQKGGPDAAPGPIGFNCRHSLVSDGWKVKVSTCMTDSKVTG